MSEQKLEIGFDHAPSKTVVRAIGGKANFVAVIYDAILPQIKNLEDKPLTVKEQLLRGCTGPS
ncbi:unnamed protein product [Penicillium pancosmium]